jgi:hypothetical protein
MTKILLILVPIFFFYACKNSSNNEAERNKYHIKEDADFKVIEQYTLVNGDTVLHGLFQLWKKKPSMHISLEGNYVDGKKEGQFYQYSPNANLIKTYTFKNDKLQDTSFSYSYPDVIESIIVYNNDTILEHTYFDDIKNPFLSFFYENGEIINLFNTSFTEVNNHSDVLSFSDSTFTYISQKGNSHGDFTFIPPYTLLLDSSTFFIRRISRKTIEIESFDTQLPIPSKFFGYSL